MEPRSNLNLSSEQSSRFTVNIMDPYELFSTPPSDMVLSSTPSKRPANKMQSSTPGRRHTNKVLNSTPVRRPHNKASTPNKPLSESLLSLSSNKNKGGRHAIGKKEAKAPSSARKAVLTKKARQKQQNDNLWDKCLKSDPQLAQFVDEFNHSLEEAISKPLDMTD